MQAEDRSEDSSRLHSGVHLRTPVRIEVDAYAGDDEITLQAIPMPIIVARWQLLAICTGCVLGGAMLAVLVVTVIGWLR